MFWKMFQCGLGKGRGGSKGEACTAGEEKEGAKET